MLSRRALVVLSVYLILLAVSHLVRLLSPQEIVEVPPGTDSATLEAVGGDTRSDRPVRIVFRDVPASSGTEESAVVLLHGSPGSKNDFDALIPALDAYRAIAPDLPGFGGSEPDVPDYSARAHARYVLQLLDALEIDRAHLVGFSMGGAVALNAYDLAPDRVRSLTLVASIGVQEMELFGDYRLNHAVHGLQLAGIWFVREGVPHMGLLDGAFFGVPYARNFYDTDQRPLREMLGRLEPPVLIVHGRKDFLVPPEAAIEHARIVPHAELQMSDASHFLVFLRGDDTGRRIAEFLDRVERGEVPSRNGAEASRVEAAAAPFDPATLPAYVGFALLLMIVLIALATLVSEDLTCIVVGLMVAQGRIGFVAGALACCIGIYVGDLLLFLAGRTLGRPAIQRAPLCWLLRPEQVDVSSRWFRERGVAVIFFSRFVPGLRLPTYFAAGTLHTSFWAFSFYFFLAVVVWTPLLVAVSMMLGDRVIGYFDLFERHALTAMLLLALWILVMVKLIVPAFSFRGRRRLVGTWRRWTRWEFWPPWLFYPPVVLWVLWLGLRYRGWLVFTAANPAIPAGGFVAESKSEILDGLSGFPEFVARSRKIVHGEDVARRRNELRAFMADHGLDYPVVLKPDAGQRGSGVAIVRDDVQVEAYLGQSRFDIVAQEYVPGHEFGVFYYRYPDEAHGRIFSITDKRLPRVEGDGAHSVEELILLDDRAVCMAEHYARAQAEQLTRVPGVGESIELVELGTHCRGAIFLDGSWIRTEALERVIDEITRGFEGFYFGRYDLRTPTVDDLQRGVHFKILELNGVTSEATHIYDPRIGLSGAYRVLFEQWRIAFEIGFRNRANGVRPARLWELLRSGREYLESSRTHARSHSRHADRD